MSDKELSTKDLQKLVAAHSKFKRQVEEIETTTKEAVAPMKDKIKRIENKLKEYINKEEGGLQKLSLSDGSLTAYARYADKYKIKDRDELYDDYILEGIDEESAAIIRERLDIFSNTIVSDPCIDFRVQSGAEEENSQLVGGKMIPGTGLHTVKEVRIVKTK